MSYMSDTSDICETHDTYISDTCHIHVRHMPHMSDTCHTCQIHVRHVRYMSDLCYTCQTHIRYMSDTSDICQTHDTYILDTCQIHVRHQTNVRHMSHICYIADIKWAQYSPEYPCGVLNPSLLHDSPGYLPLDHQAVIASAQRKRKWKWVSMCNEQEVCTWLLGSLVNVTL